MDADSRNLASLLLLRDIQTVLTILPRRRLISLTGSSNLIWDDCAIDTADQARHGLSSYLPGQQD